MKIKLNKLLSLTLATVLAFTILSTNVTVAHAKDGTSTATGFRDLSSTQVTQEMGNVWNIGNTMDGADLIEQIPGETAWQNDVTTKQIIKSVHDMGFNTLRLPVTWLKMIHDDNTIDEAWLNRIQEIMEYALSQDMYVVVNIHWDSAHDWPGWLNITNKSAADIDKLYVKFKGVWTTLANRFKNYDEHLIFEGMNEVGDSKGTMKAASANAELKIINKLNQDFVNTVRATGGNNAKRWLIVPTRFTQIAIAIDKQYNFIFPKDTNASNRIMLSAHTYDAFGVIPYGKAFQQLSQQYVQKGIPVLIGEYGFSEAMNTAMRTYYYEATNRVAKMYGIIPGAWDNNATTSDAGSYKLVDRVNCKASDKNVMDGIMRGFFNTGDAFNIVRDKTYKTTPTITPIESFTLSRNSVTMKTGDMKRVLVESETPATNNDVVLWKTSDDSIATVYDGRIRAKGIGSTTVTAFTQDGTAIQTVSVTVSDSAVSDNDKTALYDTKTYAYYDYDAILNGADPSTAKLTYPLEIGTKITLGSNVYQVTDSSLDAPKVTYVGTKSKSSTTVSIPATIKKGIYTYKVSAISADACKSMKKLTTVTIGSNVAAIGTNAFNGCKNLKSIKIKSDLLTSVDSNALKGINSKCKISVPKAKLENYKKLFKGKGQKSSVKLINL